LISNIPHMLLAQLNLIRAVFDPPARVFIISHISLSILMMIPMPARL